MFNQNRTLSDERNGADQRALAAELKLSEMLTQINGILLVDSVSAVTHERTLSAVSSLTLPVDLQNALLMLENAKLEMILFCFWRVVMFQKSRSLQLFLDFLGLD